MDSKGKLTRVAPGRTTIVINQVACGDYKAAVAYLPVIVEGTNRNPDLDKPVSAIAVGETIGRFYVSPDVKSYNTVVTSDNPSVATANLNGDWLTITGVSAGRATITLKQPNVGDYYESTLSVNVEVVRKATAETMYVRGGNASWQNSLLTWTSEYDNLLVLFDLAEGEISKYSAVKFSISDLYGGLYRVLVLDENSNILGQKTGLYNGGPLTLQFIDSTADGLNINTGGQWSKVRKICVAGNSNSGTMKVTDVELVNR